MDVDQYARHKERCRQRGAKLSAAGREIGELPPCSDPDLRDRTRHSLRLFLEEALTESFPIAWSPDHLLVIETIERTLLEGGQFALGMPRGSGKTTIAEGAILWAALHELRTYIMLIGANQTKAEDSLTRIKTRLASSDRLLALWPEVCYPVRALEGLPNRAKGQLYHGEPTQLLWGGKRRIVLPAIEGRGPVVIDCAGLKTAVRGAQVVTPAGETLRPQGALLDDPQTRESARSSEQTTARLDLINGDLMGLAGPGKTLAVVGTMTVIEAGDVADQLLNPEIYPNWHGRRLKLLDALPTRMDLWLEYQELRREALLRDQPPTAAYEFYRTHQAEMDAGSVASWPQRKLPSELSAIQHAMHLLFDLGEAAFHAEYQNTVWLPSDDETLDAEAIAEKVHHLPRGHCPDEVETITAFVDVHKRVLYWMVVGWKSDFTGFVLDYGTYPKQAQRVFTERNVVSTLQKMAAQQEGVERDETGQVTEEAAVYLGLRSLLADLIGRRFPRGDGTELAIQRLLVDGGYNMSVVVKALQETDGAANLAHYSFGRTIGPDECPISRYHVRPGETPSTEEWVLKLPAKGQRIKHVIFDANHWKTQLLRRLNTPLGSAGCLSIFGLRGERHALLARHLDAERRVKQRGEREVDVWEKKPSETQNHWLDCAVGCMVAASLLGIRAIGRQHKPGPSESFMDRYRRRKGG